MKLVNLGNFDFKGKLILLSAICKAAFGKPMLGITSTYLEHIFFFTNKSLGLKLTCQQPQLFEKNLLTLFPVHFC